MAGAKEIRTKIKSIKSTQKITKAMEMVAASKMRKAQDRMRPPGPTRKRCASDRAHGDGASEYKHPYLFERATLSGSA
jgi:F-type H+-transporting ATPase subunit gamma